MKRDEPIGEDLLAVAADVLHREIVPTLTGDERLSVLMAVNAIETARRELENAPLLEKMEHTALSEIAGGGDSRGLCRAIRNGKFDMGDKAVALHGALLEHAVLRCRISNPKYLDAAEKDWESRLLL